MDIQRDRQTDSRADRLMDRQRERQTEQRRRGDREECRERRISMGWDGIYTSGELSVMIRIFLFSLLRMMMMEEFEVSTCRDDRQR